MNKFIAGAAKRDVTPEVGVQLGGYFNRTLPSIGVHDKLFSRAVYLSDDEEQIMIIGNDQLCLSNVVTEGYLDEIRRNIEAKTRIKQDNIIIFSTHTHGAPDSLGIFGYSEKNKKYFQRLQSEIVEVAIEAYLKRKEAKIFWAKGSSKIGINRRNPISGPTDEELVTIKISSIYNNTVALLINYACHGVVLGPDNLLITADWIGYLENNLEKKYETTTMFLPGASGNINPRTNDTLEKIRNGKDVYDRTGGTFEEMERFGTIAVEDVQKILSKATQIQEPKIENKVERVKVKIENKTISNMIGKNEVITRVSATRVGNIVIVGLPGEAFVEYGLKLKSFTRYVVVPLTLANDYIGYLPTEEAFREGGYEPSVSVGLEGTKDIISAAEKLVKSFV